MEKCNYTPYGKHNIKPVYGKMQLYPIWKHNIKPEYSFQQIEPTVKSSDVLNIQWHFFKKVPWGIVHYYWLNDIADEALISKTMTMQVLLCPSLKIMTQNHAWYHLKSLPHTCPRPLKICPGPAPDLVWGIVTLLKHLLDLIIVTMAYHIGTPKSLICNTYYLVS